jgi:hypothetical protein
MEGEFKMICDILRKLGVGGVDGRPGIAPIESTDAISRAWRTDIARQASENLRGKPGIESNADELGKD